MPIDPQKIDPLLKDKKYDEARKLISDIAAEKMTDKEKGAALVGMASTYMKISNNASLEYKEALAQAIAGFKAINKGETKVNDKLKLEEVRKDLGMK